VLVIDCYPGVHESDLIAELATRLTPTLVLRTADAMLPATRIDHLVAPFLGGEDPVFGYLTYLTLTDWFDPAHVTSYRQQIEQIQNGLILVLGCGASYLSKADVLVYASLSRWEAQNRFRRNAISNLGVDNSSTPAHLQYKRAFFVDWRVADRWKKPLMQQCDFVIDANTPQHYQMADGDAVRQGLAHAVTRPFRVVPFFDPAPWGGQWMKEVCDLDRSAINYGWCFDCVPEENSLLLGLGNHAFELPAIDLVFAHPRALLGDPVHARFGDEFPIRFDLLDTMQGGNLSFQVHPLTEYIQQTFGMHYTQDESYYLLDAGPDASVYLGLQENVDRTAMERDLRAAQRGEYSFPAERYAQRWPAKKHDHFLIPAGSCHCSGANSLVLEISATPYIFTFKMWDWDRLGLDGKPRPVHLDHALANLQWDRTTDWVANELVNRVEPIAEGPGWREERTGLHCREFIESRRHWFTGPVLHQTGNSVNVLNLVQGEAAVVESPEERFEPFVVHYAETFIVPANIEFYTIRPIGNSVTTPCATIKAYVRW
jgi:mannose-6-phosphate isomerase class I